MLVPLLASLHRFAVQEFHRDIIIPFDLVLSYFSAVLFFACSMIVDACCPLIISRHKELREFLAYSQATADSISTAGGARLEAQDNIVSRIKSLVATAGSEGDGTETLRSLIQTLAVQAATKAFIDDIEPTWNVENVAKPLLRLLVTVGFATSGILALYVAFYDTPLSVFRALARP